MASKQLILFLALVASVLSKNSKLTTVAILSYPETNKTEYQASIVEANYARWLEASGADSVVIHPWTSEYQIDEILSKVNGILIQGGNVKVDIHGSYVKHLSLIVNKTMELSDKKSIVIPIMAIDQGLQLLHYVVGGEVIELKKLKLFKHSVPLLFDDEFIKTTRLFSLFDKRDYAALKSQPVALLSHEEGVNPSYYDKNEKLNRFFTITTAGKDIYENVFITSVEANHYAIYAVMFHPEYVPYERNAEMDINHSLEAVRISRAIGNFFVEKCRFVSKNKMQIEDYAKYDYINTYTNYPSKRGTRYVYVYERP